MSSSDSERAPRLLVDIAAATMLLTRFPVRWEWFSSGPPDMGRSVWANPLVGVLVGGVGAVTIVAARAFGVPPLPGAFVAVAAQVLATGGFHEDGLADVADGFGGGRTREAKLEIMKDSRIGTYGSLALLLVVGARVTALASLPGTTAVLGLVAVGAASRAAIVLLLRTLRSVRSVGLGAAVRPPTAPELSVALALGIAAAVLCLGVVPALAGLSAGGVAVVALGWVSVRQIGGYTGDVLGAGQQLFEVFFLLALASVART